MELFTGGNPSTKSTMPQMILRFGKQTFEKGLQHDVINIHFFY